MKDYGEEMNKIIKVKKEIFSKRIKDLRVSKGLTIKQLSKKIGMNQSRMSSWEQNTSFPEVAALINISTFYDISIDYILGISDKKKI